MKHLSEQEIGSYNAYGNGDLHESSISSNISPITAIIIFVIGIIIGIKFL